MREFQIKGAIPHPVTRHWLLLVAPLALLMLAYQVGNTALFVGLSLAIIPGGVLFSSFMRRRNASGPVQERLPKTLEEIRNEVLDAVPGLLFVRGAGGTLEYVNDRIVEATGYSALEFAGDGEFGLLHPDDSLRVREILDSHIALSEPFRYEFRQRLSDGSYDRFEASLRPVKDSSGKVLQWYGILTFVRNEEGDKVQSRKDRNISTLRRLPPGNETCAIIIPEISQILTAIMLNGEACLRFLSIEPANVPAATTLVKRVLRDGKDAICAIRATRTLFWNAESPLADNVRLLP